MKRKLTAIAAAAWLASMTLAAAVIATSGEKPEADVQMQVHPAVAPVREKVLAIMRSDWRPVDGATKLEVIAVFGEPSTATATGQGEWWSYQVPGGWDVFLNIRFDKKNGVVAEWEQPVIE